MLRPKAAILAWLLLAAALFPLAGCGQRGPLYLPDSQSAATNKPSPAPVGSQTPPSERDTRR